MSIDVHVEPSPCCVVTAKNGNAIVRVTTSPDTVLIATFGVGGIWRSTPLSYDEAEAVRDCLIEALKVRE